MVKRRILILFFLLTITSFYSQEYLYEKQLNTKIKEKAVEYNSYTNFQKASLFYTKKNWDSTLVYSMRHLNTSTIPELTDYCHFYRGESFLQKKIFNEAQKELSLISNTFSFYNKVTFSLGKISLELNEYKKAISYYKEIENLPKNKKSHFNKSTIFNNLGLCYLHLNEFSKAEPYMFKAIKMLESNKDTLKLIRRYNNIANIYYQQYKDNLAISYFKKAYKLSKKAKNYDLKQITAKNMAVVEENRKNYAQALIYRKEYENWNDSLNDQNKIWNVAELEKQFAIKEKEKEVSLLQAENKIKVAERNKLLYSAVILLLLLATGIYFYREKLKANKIILAQKESLDQLNETKDKLFSIVSHDLRSSVNALKTSNTKLLQNLASKNFEKLDSLLNQNSSIVNGAYNLLDNLLHWALQQTKQAYFEITAIRLFFIVEQMAYNYEPLMLDKEIQFKNNVLKSDIIYADQESLKIMLRNLLDNAIKFSTPKGFIKIYTQNTSETYCELVIEDSGIGMDDATRIELQKDSPLLSKKKNENTIGTGLGLQLCKSIIKKNKGTLAIESELGKGTKMIVSLPKKQLNG